MIFYFLFVSFTAMGLVFRASLSCDWAHFIPLLRMFLFPPICMFGNFPFFFIIIVIDSNATLIAIINSVNNKVLNISIIFVLTFFEFHYKDSAFVCTLPLLMV